MKTFSFILVSTFFAYLLAQDCNNPLLNVFNLAGLQTPESGNGLPFCSNLQNGQTCCSSQTVQGFQSRLNTLTTSLQGLAGQRDAYMVELYANYSSEFQQAADDLTDYSDEISRIENQNATLGNEIRSQYQGLNRIARALDNIDDQFRSSVQEYQERRVACFNTVLQIQSSAWCLACDPNYASRGVRSDGSVDSASSVCNALSRNCAPYVRQADYLNPLWQAQQAYQRLTNLTRYLRFYRNNNFQLDENYLLGDEDISESNNATERTSALPRNCTNSSCEWQCSNFFFSGLVLNDTIVANGGGIIGGDDIDYPPVGVNAPARGRLLQNLQQSLWNPNLAATGLTFTVVEDPADIAVVLQNAIYDDSSNGATDNPNTETDNDDGLTDNDGVNTPNDLTDNDGINTPTDNDGVNTPPTANDLTDGDGINTPPTDNDGINTAPTDNDGINTAPTDNDGVNTPNDMTDGDGINTPPTANDDTDNNP